MDINSLPGNSNRQKEKEPAPEKHITKKVIQGEAKVKKSLGKRFAEAFTPSDVDSIKDYIFTDVIVPAIKDAINDAVTGALQMFLFDGVRSSSRRRKDRDRTSYSSFYEKGGRDSRDSQNKTSSPIATGNWKNWKDITLESRADAEDVLAELQATCRRYGKASVGDLYDALGKPCEFTAYSYGWTNLDDACVRRLYRGWGFDMPGVQPIK